MDVSEFNEHDVNRDADGKFASRVSGEPEVTLDNPTPHLSESDIDALMLAYDGADADGKRVMDMRFDAFHEIENPTQHDLARIFPGHGSEHARRDVLAELNTRHAQLKANVNYLKDGVNSGKPINDEVRETYHRVYDEYRNVSSDKHVISMSLKSDAERASYEAWQERTKDDWKKNYTPKPFDAVLSESEKATWRRALEPDGAVFVDLETTTTDPMTGHIIEAAFIREDGTTHHEFFGVPAEHERWNGTGAQHIHHISPNEVADKPVFSNNTTARNAMRAFVGDRVLVAHNARFERNWLSKNGLDIPTVDTKKMLGAMQLDEGIEPSSASTTMEALCERAGVPYENAHRAINDTTMMAEAFERLRPSFEQFVQD